MNTLVHICCGPCSITVLQRLADAGHDLTGYFFNPNIHPLAEYLHRREGALQVAEKLGISMIMADSLPMEEQRWFAPESLDDMSVAPVTSGLLPSAKITTPAVPAAANPVPWLRLMAGREHDRCGTCWRIRLYHTARQAAAGGFAAFTSTLLYSRYQKHEAIRALGESAAAAHGVTFLYEDFRTSWQQGIALSKEWGIYRQQYCGCIFSEYDRYAREASVKCGV